MEVSVIMEVGFVLLGLLLFGRDVQCEKSGVVKVGAVFTFDSVIGRAAKVAMEMAVEDVNSDPTVLNGTKLEMIMEDSSCSVFMGSIKAFEAVENEIVAIIGPQSSSTARIMSHIANGLRIPVISYAATDPTLSSLQFPYFLRTTSSDTNQMSAIADILDFHNWKEIIAIFVDNEYGRNGISVLETELYKKLSRISYKLPLSPQYNISEIYHILKESKAYGPRVYVVHIDPDPQLKFFRIVTKLNMIARNYVWLATDWLTSTLDLAPRGGIYENALQGVVTLRPHIPIASKRYPFMSRHRNINVYGLYAYDSVWALARSVDRFLKERGEITFSLPNNLQLGNINVFDGGEVLLKFILDSNFTGLTGQVLFDAERNRKNVGYEILNVVRGKSLFKVGHWSNEAGLDVQDQKLDSIIWPGGEDETPRGWVIATKEKPMRIGYPRRVSFSEFVTEMNESKSVQGYCIDLFDEVLKMVPYEVPFRFEPFGDGLKNPSYDELVRMVANDVFDAAVGDIAIVTNRIQTVDFTQPFVSTGLVVVAPTQNFASSGWVFIRPFTLEMWCATAASFVVIAVVIWILEHRVNDHFRGPPQRQLKTMFLFSFSTLFKANYEKTISSLGKFVMVVWLFLLLVVTSSYTASLSSILTVKQLSTGITGIDNLISSGLPIGYQVGSFAYSYLRNSLDVQPSRLVSLGSPEEYERALRQGPLNGGVAAIVDEVPYVELFLSNQTDFGIVGQTFTKSGWGFAFKRDSPLVVDMSTAILKLMENGGLQKIHNKWFCKKGCPDEQRGRDSKPNQLLRLSSFWALYSLCGVVALTSFVLFLIGAVRQYIKYRNRQRDPSSPAFSASSSNVVFSQAVHSFLEFIDEKEEAIKRNFTQHDTTSPAQVSR